MEEVRDAAEAKVCAVTASSAATRWSYFAFTMVIMMQLAEYTSAFLGFAGAVWLNSEQKRVRNSPSRISERAKETCHSGHSDTEKDNRTAIIMTVMSLV